MHPAVGFLFLGTRNSDRGPATHTAEKGDNGPPTSLLAARGKLNRNEKVFDTRVV
jgi:hypothetical protein